MTAGYTHLGYLIAGWSITFAVFALYAVHLVRRGRELARQVAPERRRWMTSDTSAAPEKEPRP